MSDSSQFQTKQLFLPLHTSIDEKLISKIHKQVKKQNSIVGVWSDKQNLIYAKFIQAHPFEFQTAEKRRRFKVFQRMALKLPNRTAIQCRSHNQKMVKLAGSIMKVPEYIKKRLINHGRKIEHIENEISDSQKQITKQKDIEHIYQSRESREQQKEQSCRNMRQKERFEIPLKLCIEIISDRIEEYC